VRVLRTCRLDHADKVAPSTDEPNLDFPGVEPAGHAGDKHVLLRIVLFGKRDMVRVHVKQVRRLVCCFVKENTAIWILFALITRLESSTSFVLSGLYTPAA
jgi:hypothetical protein